MKSLPVDDEVQDLGMIHGQVISTHPRDPTVGSRSSQTQEGIQKHGVAPDESMYNLLAHGAPEAHHDSDIVSMKAPQIHEGTRQHIFKEIDAWITDSGRKDTTSKSAKARRSRPKCLLWLSGPNGSGKTSIQRDLAGRCHRDGRLLASFFFNSQSTILNDKAPFVATLAYQIASNIPGLWDFVSSSIQDNPDVFTRSLDAQMLNLIFQPLERFHRYSTHNYWWRLLKESINSKRGRSISQKLQQCQAFKERHADWWNRNIIIVDGIDECNKPSEFDGVDHQGHIIGIMHWASLHKKFPLRFVASAPEDDPVITEEFATAARNQKLLTKIELDAYRPASDILVYLHHEFARICRTHPLMQGNLDTKGDGEDDWPGLAVLKLLITKAGFLFVYASTIVRLVDSPHHDPITTLNRIMSSIPDQNIANYRKPYAELDALYKAIIQPPVGNEDGSLQRIVHAIATKQIETTSELDEHLSLTPGSTEAALRDHLYPLVYTIVPSSDSESPTSSESKARGYVNIGFYHKSVLDFLLSEERSGDLWIRPPVPRWGKRVVG